MIASEPPSASNPVEATRYTFAPTDGVVDLPEGSELPFGDNDTGDALDGEAQFERARLVVVI